MRRVIQLQQVVHAQHCTSQRVLWPDARLAKHDAARTARLLRVMRQLDRLLSSIHLGLEATSVRPIRPMPAGQRWDIGWGNNRHRFEGLMR